jgi:hypothetical protein
VPKDHRQSKLLGPSKLPLDPDTTELLRLIKQQAQHGMAEKWRRALDKPPQSPKPEPPPAPTPKRSRRSKQERVISFILEQLGPNADRAFVIAQILVRWDAACRQLGIKHCEPPDPRTIDKHIAAN